MKKLSRKVIALTLAFIMALGVAPIGGMIDFDLFGVSVNAASESDLTFKLINDDTEYEVSDCDEEASGELIIPSTYNGLPVTSIGAEAFFNCKGLTSIIIPDSITSINSWAFEACTGLTSITVPNSVTSIGYDCFNGCTNLASVAIGNGVTSIAKGTFDDTAMYNNNSNWDNGVLYIGNCLIKAKEDISGVYTIKEGTQMIADRAFEKCTGLTSITVPNSVTSIGHGCFNGCTNLASVAIGNGVTSIGEEAFNDTALYNNNSSWDNGVLYIGNCLIKANEDISDTYTIKEGTRMIADRTFEKCTGLTSFTVPDSITSIGNWAFYACSSLKSITIPDSVTSIGKYAFAGCNSLSSITIPDSVTSIGRWTFEGCTALESVSIGSGVTGVFASTFEECPSLTNITVSSDNAYYSSDEYGVLYNKDKTVIIKHPAGNKRTSFALPNSVTTIGYRAFSGCDNLTSVTIPNSVTSIGEYAFVGCNSLSSITIPNSVTSINDEAFGYCESLSSITIPDSVISIGDWTFEGCTALESVSIGSGVTGVFASTFEECPSLTNITVSSDNAYYSNDEYGVLYNKDKTVIIKHPAGNKRTSFAIPNSVTTIEYGAFYGCDNLTSITIPDSVTNIGEYAFAGCESLSSITIPDSVTSIGYVVFEGCTALESVSIGSGVTGAIASNFEGCFSLTNITVSSDNAYYSSDENGVLYNKNKTELIIYPFGSERTSFQIPNSVTNIASAAFFGCKFLQEINVDSSSKSFSSKDGVLFNKDKTSLICYPNSKPDLYYEVPKGVTRIEYGSFSDNTTCEYLVIPDSVTYIGYGEIDAETIIYDGSVEQWYNIECHSYFGEETSLIVAKQNLAIRVLTAFLKMMLKLYNKLNSILISMQ